VTWTARILTLFPEMFPGPLGASLAGRALERGDWSLDVVDIRGFARDKHRSVDDAPFGGGAGMVMLPQVLDEAIAATRRPGDRLIYPSPRGRLLDQALVGDLASEQAVMLLCGRYEGVDQRVLDAHGAEEVSLGDFILSGGEIAAIALIDAVVRLLPGVMGNAASAEEESFGDGTGAGLLEYPHYTRPSLWQGADGVPRAVPEILVSGHHDRVRRWRLEQAETITRERRPDLWQRYLASHPERGEGHVRKRPGEPRHRDVNEDQGR
jgi:tRNA (guanine37-N1)-methyltransferase